MLFRFHIPKPHCSLHDFRQQTHHYALDRDDQVSKAIKALSDTITPARLSRADVSACQRQVDELQTGLAKLRKENEKSAFKFLFYHIVSLPW